MAQKGPIGSSYHAAGFDFGEGIVLARSTTGEFVFIVDRVVRFTIRRDGTINIIPRAGDPASPQDGDIWYDDTAGLFQFREEGVTMTLSGTDAPVDATYVVTSANAELTAELVLGTDVIMIGTAAARPAAGTAGRLYFSTDTSVLERDSGAAWATYSPAGHTIRENGTDQTSRAGLNFVDTDAGAGLITDDAGGNETEVNLSLYRLEAADHSHQSAGLQAGQLDHGLALTGLIDDDHTQYLLVSGTRAMTGDLNMGSQDIINALTLELESVAPATPVANTSYTDTLVCIWANILGADTPPTIADDYNVTSITDNAVGDWTLNAATAWASSTILGITGNVDSSGGAAICAFNSNTTSSIRFTFRLTGTLTDSNAANFGGIGGW